MPDVEIPTKSGPMPGYLATPDGAGPFPGVVVIHDVMGMSPDVRHQADWLASEGFVAVAPDFFHWGHKVMCIRTVFSNMRARRGPGLRRCRVDADVAARAARLLGQDRGHRLLHGWRIRVAVGAGARVLCVERQLRTGAQGR